MEILSLLLIFVAIELFESNWQKSDTLYGLLDNNYQIYKKSLLLYFLLNGSFFYSIYLSISLHNTSFLMLSIIAIKFFDMAFKLTLLRRIDMGYNIEEVIPNVIMTPLLRYLNVVIYPVIFYFATL